jgi:hypothetical protein
MGDSAYDDTTDLTIPSRGENKLVVTNYKDVMARFAGRRLGRVRSGHAIVPGAVKGNLLASYRS